MDIFNNVPVQFINSFTPLQAWVVVFCAQTLGIIAICVTLLFLLFRPIKNRGLFSPFQHIAKRFQDLFVVSLSCVTTVAFTVFLKTYFKILRPSVFDIHLHSLLLKTDFGFPSGHASVYAALAASLYFVNHKAGIVAGVAALIIGLGRVLAGVHTPLDIFGGYLLGCSISALIAFTVQVINGTNIRVRTNES